MIAAGVLASVTFYELFPGRMSPNSLVDESLERIRNCDEVHIYPACSLYAATLTVAC